jgi:hypothetical protein
VHNVFAYPSWLERYDGPHPEQIKLMIDDLRDGDGAIALRPTADVERLLQSRWYDLGRWLLIRLDPWDLRARRLGQRVRRVGRQVGQLARRMVRGGAPR